MAYCQVQKRLNLPEFQELHNKVTPVALDLLKEQISLAKGDKYQPGCTGSFTKKYGLPYCHTLHRRAYRSASAEIIITLEEIDPHWHYYLQRSSEQILPAVVSQDPATVKGKGRPKKQKMSASNSRPSTLTDSQRVPSSFEVVAESQITATQRSHVSHTPGHGHRGDGGQSQVSVTANSATKPDRGNTASQPIEIEGSALEASRDGLPSTQVTAIVLGYEPDELIDLSQFREEFARRSNTTGNSEGKKKRGRPIGSKDK
ncbi:uncharacterized protein EI97DRAFT_499561 [Westerdykella ornata]|uniref:Uncharacterized protein n=1 Tax=Westerdykella ornata TaxID=318751 RepID=A0A6A6JRP4_WESOR|nr:uncharacterized protein EI97DRAFT_499561 [Westerdykella ornata]KAF2279067.1 hypothetical protein EI97DRAFT_499561 [Westerdykella ornata]